MDSAEVAAELLTLEHVFKSFGATRVLHDVSLSLDAGEILFLVGASGCGKTTLLRVIAGFEMADSGRLQIGRHLMFDAEHFVPPRERRLGYVLQEGVLFPHLNVWRNIAYGLGNGKGRTEAERARIREVMELTDIVELAERMPHQISGGQQQRVALARALAPQPSIMLLDEPFSALDEHLRAQIRDDVIDILRRSHAAAIIVTHDRHEALSSADRIGVIQGGRLMQLATPREIYQCPATPAVARFMSDHGLLLPARMESDGLHASSALTGRVPVGCVDDAAPTPRHAAGQILIRSDQLVPVHAEQSDGMLFQAVVRRIAFHGTHSQVDIRAGDTPLSLDLNNEFEALKPGDHIGLRLIGKAIFYPDD